MFNWFRRRAAKFEDAPKDEIQGETDVALTNSLIQLQRDYWTYHADEQAELLAKYRIRLSWPETLRLQHLTCLQLLSSEAGRAGLMDADQTEVVLPETPEKALCEELMAKLLSHESPYRIRHGFIWQRDGIRSERNRPDLEGPCGNLSATHLGCLEVIRLNDRYSPTEIAFIPFDDITEVIFADPSLFRPAKIVYADLREELVRIPLLYGVSWLTDNSYDHDGTLTRLCCYLDVEQLNLGIGVGHQDLSITQANGFQTLCALGSVSRIAIPLALDDSRFAEKCRAQGLDPEMVKRQLED